MLPISFNFDCVKAIQAMAMILKDNGTTNKVALTKLLYLAEREHFIRYGMPITGDRLVAMDYGPVPSKALDLLNGQFYQADSRGKPVKNFTPYEYIHLDDVEVYLRKDPGEDRLSTTERRIIREVVARRRTKDTWQIVAETHKLPEYKKIYRPGTSTLIPYELMAELSDNPKLFRLNRMVISPELAIRMQSPFARETDL